MKYTIKTENKWLVLRRWWCFKDKVHREDGPAVEQTNGIKRWYLNDKWFTEAQFKARKA